MASFGHCRSVNPQQMTTVFFSSFLFLEEGEKNLEITAMETVMHIKQAGLFFNVELSKSKNM